MCRPKTAWTPLHMSGLDQSLRPAHGFLRGLKQQAHLALPFGTAGGQQRGGAQLYGHVRVMPARVHDAPVRWNRRRVRALLEWAAHPCPPGSATTPPVLSPRMRPTTAVWPGAREASTPIASNVFRRKVPVSHSNPPSSGRRCRASAPRRQFRGQILGALVEGLCVHGLHPFVYFNDNSVSFALRPGRILRSVAPAQQASDVRYPQDTLRKSEGALHQGPPSRPDPPAPNLKRSEVACSNSQSAFTGSVTEGNQAIHTPQQTQACQTD